MSKIFSLDSSENNFKIKLYENTFKLVDLTDHYFFIL